MSSLIFSIVYSTSHIFHTIMVYSLTCLKRPLKNKTKVGFQCRLLLNAGQKYCRMLQGGILQYFRPSLSYHLTLRSLFCLFLSNHLRQVLLYVYSKCAETVYNQVKKASELEVWSLYHLFSLKTKSSQCHYVMTL